jgi:hypothetical protein
VAVSNQKYPINLLQHIPWHDGRDAGLGADPVPGRRARQVFENLMRRKALRFSALLAWLILPAWPDDAHLR